MCSNTERRHPLVKCNSEAGLENSALQPEIIRPIARFEFVLAFWTVYMLFCCPDNTRMCVCVRVKCNFEYYVWFTHMCVPQTYVRRKYARRVLQVSHLVQPPVAHFAPWVRDDLKFQLAHERAPNSQYTRKWICFRSELLLRCTEYTVWMSWNHPQTALPPCASR